MWYTSSGSVDESNVKSPNSTKPDSCGWNESKIVNCSVIASFKSKIERVRKVHKIKMWNDVMKSISSLSDVVESAQAQKLKRRKKWGREIRENEIELRSVGAVLRCVIIEYFECWISFRVHCGKRMKFGWSKWEKVKWRSRSAIHCVLNDVRCGDDEEWEKFISADEMKSEET